MFSSEIGVANIPLGLDAMPPGPGLAAILSSIDIAHLSGRDAVHFARATHRQIAHDQARQYRALSRIGDLYAGSGSDTDLCEFASAEVGAGLTLTRRTADREMGMAFDLTNRYPRLLEALESGLIDVPKVRTVIRGVGHVDQTVADEAIESILRDVSTMTTGQIASRLRRLVIEGDPGAAKKAYLEGIDARKVWAELAPDGTGTLIATGLHAQDLSAASRNINGIARRIKNDGDDRSIDQIRCDVFSRLLTGADTRSSQKGQITMTADLTTLADLDARPGHLNGFGPIIADVVRQVADQQRDATWVFEVTDNQCGEVYVGTTSRRPTVEQQRKIVARYRTCVHPGCRMSATQCDLDHTEEWAVGGLTTLCNLAPLCRYHHRLKHLTAWSYRKLVDGSIEWTTQFGLHYITHPP